MTKKAFLGEVEFNLPITLPDLAKRIEMITGISMHYDHSDKYDEFPTFLGECAGLELILMGAPAEEATREIQLTIQMNTEFSFEKLWNDIPQFFHKIIYDKNPDGRGFVDCSEELAQELRSQGFLECIPLR
jgi:hypothetical protein